MAEYVAPGVYVEELPSRPRPIDGVSTSTAGMAGATERGPTQPQLITSWRAFQDTFGGLVNGLFLPAAVQGFFENGGGRVYIARAVGSGSTAPQPADVIGNRDAPVDARTGLAALEAIDEISILLSPDEVTDRSGAITSAVIDQCERLRDRFAIVSAHGNHDDIATLRPPRDTSYGAFYYPWLRVQDPAVKPPVLVPPSGHVAGIYARTDSVRGVHKAPANEIVRGLFSGGAGDLPPLEFTITDREQEVLNPRGVNVIRDFSKQGRGILLWGARTMSSDTQWRYVNVRRLFAYIEESIAKGTRWVEFEPNAEPTWSQFRLSVNMFLLRHWRDGALMGSKDNEAFFVTCDRTTMTQDDIDNGRLIGVIGVAPARPAEFVVFRISHKTADAKESSS